MNNQAVQRASLLAVCASLLVFLLDRLLPAAEVGKILLHVLSISSYLILHTKSGRAMAIVPRRGVSSSPTHIYSEAWASWFATREWHRSPGTQTTQHTTHTSLLSHGQSTPMKTSSDPHLKHDGTRLELPYFGQNTKKRPRVE